MCEKNFDVEITKVENILKHKNADKLELAVVHGWICAIKKGSLKIGDDVIYIHPDAQINSENNKWAESLLPFLGRNGRVKTIKLRGEFSEGIIIPFTELKEKLPNLKLDMSPEELSHFLGITHWTMKSSAGFNRTSFDQTKIRFCNLPYNLEKTDQKNFQSLKFQEYAGKDYILTRKKDGSSCTITFDWNQNDCDIHVTSRRLDLKIEDENCFSFAAKPVIEKIKNFPDVVSKFLTENLGPEKGNLENNILVLRGEVCGDGINKNPVNLDSVGIPTFHLFEALVLEKSHTFKKQNIDIYNVADFFKLNVVPKLGEVTNLQTEFCLKLLNAPASEGEGVVLWEFKTDENGKKTITGNSFKCRSREYDSKM